MPVSPTSPLAYHNIIEPTIQPREAADLGIEIMSPDEWREKMFSDPVDN